MKYILLFSVLLITSCSNTSKSKVVSAKTENPENFIAVLDTIWQREQLPIRARDSLIKIYGTESELVKEQQAIYKNNHIINERKVKNILDSYGWPSKEMSGEQGNWTICNVIQHSDNEVRIQYLPMMRQAVKDRTRRFTNLWRANEILSRNKKFQCMAST